MSFFGFDTALPERRPDQPKPQLQGQQGGYGFQNTTQSDSFGMIGGAGEDEDLAVYNWGDPTANLMEGGDDFNDETFGGGPIDNNFQFSAPAPSKPSTKARGNIASTESRYKPKTVHDPFAFSEDDFYSSRRGPSKPKPSAKPPQTKPEPTWSKPEPARPMWGAAPSTTTTNIPGPGQIKTLEEIEAEMSSLSIPEEPKKPQVLSLEEIERQMMASEAPSITPPRDSTPVQTGLAGSGYTNQQSLLDNMFPELGKASINTTTNFSPAPPEQRQPSPEEIARREAMHQRITEKIESMAKYNHLMGNSDKDFITRIQLSQLVTSDPYSSDFYAQVFSALKRRQQEVQGPDAPSVVPVTAGMAFAVSGPTNRFGKMGTQTMQRLSSQVKKLVENKAAHQKNMGTAALQGALGKVTRGSVTAPRPVLAVPTGKPENRPVNALNQQSGVKRQALTKKQVMVALEELYDAVLDLEQTRRQMPPPDAIGDIQAWEMVCAGKIERIWRRLMVMEPLDISNPHPFISLLTPLKGQRLFPRLLRHLPHDKALTLLTLLIATYPQLEVVSRAPPPPVADSSLLTKADRLDRAKREAETDNFLHCVVPGMDMLINRCKLGLVAGLLGICAQRMDLVKVAKTRPGVALFTALLSRAQSTIRDPSTPADPAEIDQWNKTFAYFLQVLIPHLAELFPSAVAQRAAFGPGAYLMNTEVEKEGGVEMERREAEAWGFTAALAVNAPEEEQTNLVAALREKIIHTVQAARNGVATNPQRAELKLRNVNMFLNGLGLDASMIE